MTKTSNRSVMKHDFSRVPRAEIPRSVFDRSHGHKTTFDAGYLIPFYVDEALPGDTVTLDATLLVRMTTPVFPLMDNLFVDTHFFAVPNRLLWDNWERFLGAQDNPADSTDYLVPQMVSTASTGYAEASLHDYMGIPPGIPDLTHSALFHRAYNLIYNEWYRDQNLVDSVVVDTDDGPDDPADYVLLKRAKRHDYFTSCLPWPQKSDSVSIPLGTSAPVLGLAVATAQTYPGSESGLKDSVSDPSTDAGNWTAASPGIYLKGLSSGDALLDLRADLTNASAATINQLRQSFAVQKLYERDARGGTRHVEVLKAHFGVTNPDFRMQRPEYLGGGSTPVTFTPVQQTSSTDATTPQGNLSAFSVSVGHNHGFTKSFTEHCVLIGIVSVRSDLTYQQGLERMWSRSTRLDFYWPALSHIGEQAVLNKEIYAQGSLAATDDDVFGYQERNAEYRYKPSRISGAFRSSAAAPLDSWHLSQEFGALPTLDQTFREESPPMDRVLAVASEPDFLMDSYIRMRSARPMPVFGVPGLIDHF